MICEIMVYSSVSLNFAKLFVLFLLNILYLFRHIIYKWCILFLFKRIKYGNISIVERSAILKSDYTLEQVDKEILNVVNNPKDPSVILYITNEKFYENLLFYGERGLKESFENDFHTKNLYELFEIIYAPPTQEWSFYKKFVDAYNIKKPEEPKNETLIYKEEEFIFHVNEKMKSKLSTMEEIKIVIHNGNFDFKNTSMESNILTDSEISKNILFKRLERVSPNVFPNVENYYDTFLKFLFQKNYLTYNYYFCKK